MVVEHRLTTILAADVVGYSTLMEHDEAGTHERLKVRRKELFEPEIARHHGRIFKTMGDGMLAEFGSVVHAVECAVSLQRGLAERNADVAEDQRIEMRIGINLGEVIVEGDDRFGEGVNIAARLEQLADPGGICVSGKVAKEVEKKLAFGFEPMGEQQVKNIAEPVLAFRVRLDGVPTRQPLRMKPSSFRYVAAVGAAMILLVGGTVAWFMLRTPVTDAIIAAEPAVTDGKPSLVVLPFDNLSDDKEQGYLADGITDDLTTGLARVPGLFVISRNAAFTFRGKTAQPGQIAKELGVHYILEGSTRRVGEEFRINAQLIDARTGGHLWAERFDGKWAEVFALQDKVVENVAGALKLRLVTGEGKAQIAGSTSNPAAYEAFLRGLEFEHRNTPADIAVAVTYYEQALALDPNFGRAIAELAWAYWNTDDQRVAALGHWEENNAKLYKFLAAAAKHPSPNYYQINAQILTRERKSDEAVASLQKAVALDPSDPGTYEGLSQALIFNGRPKEGRTYLDEAMRIAPTGLSSLTGWRYYLAGLAAFGEDRFEDAAAELEKIDLRSADPWAKFYGLQVLIAASGHLGRGAWIAKSNFEAVLKDMGEGPYNMLQTQRYFVFKNEADIKRLLDGLGKAGVPELPHDDDLKSKDRLKGADISSLIYGRELRGRSLKPEIAGYRQAMSADGTISTAIGSWWLNTGRNWVQGDFICSAYPKDLTNCGAIFRNPSGTFEQKNEYFGVYQRNRFEFSVIK